MSNTIWAGKVEQDLIRNISDVVWDVENLSPIAIIHRVQGLLYEYEQICDHATQEEEQHYSEYSSFYRG